MIGSEYAPPSGSAFPPVLDACCGARMFWFNKRDPRAVYVDKRRETFTHVRVDCGNKTVTVDPDTLADFTDLPFPSDTFDHVVFDPPHIVESSASGNMAKYYGVLGAEWREELRRGFAECFRVLRPGGTLVFKWADTSRPVREILALTPVEPLYGHRVGARSRTHWIAFLKPNDMLAVSGERQKGQTA